MKREQRFLVATVTLLCVAAGVTSGLLVGEVASQISRLSAADRLAAREEQQATREPRSPKWPAVRDAFVKEHPECAACGSKGTKDRPLQVHHVIPFSVDANGDDDEDGIPNELDPDNLITLCTDGVGHCNCHLLIGHGGNLRCHNRFVRRDAKRFSEMLNGKTCNPRETSSLLPLGEGGRRPDEGSARPSRVIGTEAP